jgi:hypothetical protein
LKRMLRKILEHLWASFGHVDILLDLPWCTLSFFGGTMPHPPMCWRYDLG